MERDKSYSKINSKPEINTAVLTLPSQIEDTRLSLLPRTLSSMESIGIRKRRTLPILSSCQNDEDFIKLGVTAAYQDDRVKPILMAEIDSVTKIEAEKISKDTAKDDSSEKSKVWDVFTIGTGWGGVIFVAKVHSILPASEIIMVDDRNRRGGQFRDDGFDYTCNSPTEGDNSGLPGELDGPNNLGPDVFLQIGELAKEPFPFKQTVGDTIAIDGFYEAPAIPESEVVDLHITGDPTRPYRVDVLDKKSGNENNFYSKVVVFATGQGKSKWGFDTEQSDTKEAIEENSGNIFVADEFRAHLALQSAEELLSMVQKGIAFGGGRDGTNIALRYIISRLRENLTDQEINHLSVNVYGAYYESADNFSEIMGTHVYDDLLPFIGDFIKPQKEKIDGLFKTGEGIGLKLANGEQTQVGTFCASAGYTDRQIQSLLKNVSPHKDSLSLENVTGTGELEGQVIAQKIESEDIFIVGVAAREKKPPRKGKSLRTFGRAIRKHAPRVLNAAEHISQRLESSSTSEGVLYEREHRE